MNVSHLNAYLLERNIFHFLSCKFKIIFKDLKDLCPLSSTLKVTLAD